MNVPNNEKKAFRDMTPEERSAIVEAGISRAGIDVYSHADGGWVEADYEVKLPENAYRTRPRQLVIPWEHIKPEYKWAAMDADGEVYAFDLRPSDDADQWVPTGDKAIMINGVLNINTAGIDWRESLTARPEGV